MGVLSLRNIWVVRAGGGVSMRMSSNRQAPPRIGCSRKKDISRLKSRDAFLSELTHEQLLTALYPPPL